MHSQKSMTSAQTRPLDLQRLEEAGLRITERRYEPDETIFMAGDPADRLYLLAGGTVRLCRIYGSYSQATIALLKERGGFGEFDVFADTRQSASAEAVTECRVAAVRKGDLRLAMEREPKLAVELFSLFSEKLRYSEQMMDVLVYREVGARLRVLLYRLAEDYAEPGESSGAPVIPFTHGELASMVACTREAVTKALKELQYEGLVDLDRKKLKISDRARLGAQSL